MNLPTFHITTFMTVFICISTSTKANNMSLSEWSPTTIMPSGCECQKGGVVPYQCNSFDCDCGCDLTPNSCDLNCCCDEDCTNTEVSRFQVCVNDEKRSTLHGNIMQMCYESDIGLEKVNVNYPMKVEESIEVRVVSMRFSNLLAYNHTSTYALVCSY